METDLVLQMRRRIRLHLLTALGGVVGAAVLAFLGAVVLGAVYRGHVPDSAGATLGILAFAMIPGFGFYSTFRNLRCPACNALVVRQVQVKYSLFSALGKNECKSCGAKIFADDTSKRVGRAMLITAGIAIIVAIVAGILSARHH